MPALGNLLTEITRLRGQVAVLQQIVQPGNGELSHDSERLDELAFDESGELSTTIPSDSAEERAQVG